MVGITLKAILEQEIASLLQYIVFGVRYQIMPVKNVTIGTIPLMIRKSRLKSIMHASAVFKPLIILMKIVLKKEDVKFVVQSDLLVNRYIIVIIFILGLKLIST